MKYLEILSKAKSLVPDAQKYFKKNKSKGLKLDPMFHKEHEKAFKKIDCLACANCCRTTSPIFRDVDIKRIAKSERMSEKQFIQQYLHMDDESDYVLNSSPCTFLDLETNKCNIYENRPLACREYPHTDRKNMSQILDLTVKNMEVCPAVTTIVEQILQSDKDRKNK